MLADLKVMLEKRDFEEGNTSTPGDFVVERAFVGEISGGNAAQHKGEPGLPFHTSAQGGGRVLTPRQRTHCCMGTQPGCETVWYWGAGWGCCATGRVPSSATREALALQHHRGATAGGFASG